MKNAGCLIVFLAIGLIGLGQNGAGLTGCHKKKVERISKNYITKNKYQNCHIINKEKSLLLEIRDSSVQIADYLYLFDDAGICNEERKLTRCNGCLLKFLDYSIADTKFGWIKLNSNLYVSKYANNRRVEIVDKEGECPYIKTSIVNWNKQEYQNLIAQYAK